MECFICSIQHLPIAHIMLLNEGRHFSSVNASFMPLCAKLPKAKKFAKRS